MNKTNNTLLDEFNETLKKMNEEGGTKSAEDIAVTALANMIVRMIISTQAFKKGYSSDAKTQRKLLNKCTLAALQATIHFLDSSGASSIDASLRSSKNDRVWRVDVSATPEDDV